ncbi:hypothetical protein [Algoriphagus namhaensis]
MIRIGYLLLLSLGLGLFPPKAQAQTDEVQQLLLNVEKLEQLREMLENMREKYQILSQGYQQIKGIAEGNFTLHQSFLNRLVQVNPQVRAYHKVGEILDIQVGLIRGLAKVRKEMEWADFLQEGEFVQIDRLFGIWSRSSLNLLEELFLVLSDNTLQMDDWERIEAIDRVHRSVVELSQGVAMFSNSLSQLGHLRSKKSAEIQTVQSLLGNEN